MTYTINSITATNNANVLMLNVTGDIGEGEETFDYCLHSDDPHGIAPLLRKLIEEKEPPYEVLPYVPPPPPTFAELEPEYEAVISAHIHDVVVAQPYKYDNISSVAGWAADTPDETFTTLEVERHLNAAALQKWRRMVWRKADMIYADVLAGNRTLPEDPKDILPELPAFPLEG